MLILVTFSTALQGTVGFGFAVALTPLLALFIEPRDAVALTLLLGALVSVGLYFGHAEKAPPRRVLPIVIGGLVGTPIGLAVLLAVEEQTLRLLIGAAVVAVATGNAVHGRLGQPRRPGIWPIGGGVGLISGAMRGAVGMPGPPVLIYQHYLGGSAGEIRAEMFAYMLLFTPLATLIAAFTGVFTRDVLVLAPVGLVGVASGVALASVARPRVDQRWFGVITAVVLVAAGGSAFVAALLA